MMRGIPQVKIATLKVDAKETENKSERIKRKGGEEIAIKIFSINLVYTYHFIFSIIKVQTISTDYIASVFG